MDYKKLSPLLVLLLVASAVGWQQNTYLAVGERFCDTVNLDQVCCDDFLRGTEEAANSSTVLDNESILSDFSDTYNLRGDNCDLLGRTVGFTFKNNNPKACMEFFTIVDDYSEEYGLDSWSVHRCDVRLIGTDLGEFTDNLARNWKKGAVTDENLGDLRVFYFNEKEDTQNEPILDTDPALNETNSTDSGGSNFTIPQLSLDEIGIETIVTVAFSFMLSFWLVWTFIYRNISFSYAHTVAGGYVRLILYTILLGTVIWAFLTFVVIPWLTPFLFEATHFLV